MICKKCGTQLDDNAVYCYNCGFIFEKPRQPQQPVYEQNGTQWNNNSFAPQKPPENEKLLWYKVIIPVTAVIVVIAIVCGLYAGGVFKGNDWQVEVPDVVGLQYDKANSKLENKTLHCLISDKVSDANVEENNVLSQDPTAETVAGKGSIVDVVISSGAEKIYLPDLANCSLDYVESIFKDRGLNYEQKTAKGDYDMYAPNSVCYYSGEEGTPFSKDETVVIYVKAESEKESSKVSLPDLVKMDFDEAQDKLYKDGIYIAVSGYEYNDNIAENKIISQSIEKSSQVEKGSVVYVTVSLGKEKVYMPDVTLMTEENAKKTLEAVGIKIKKEEEESKVIAKGTVINQNTNPGTQVEKGFEVTLTVSSGYAVTVPDVVGLSEKEAVKRLLEADLAVNVEYVETEEKGVIEQSLKADEKTQIGTAVTIKVAGKKSESKIDVDNDVKDDTNGKSDAQSKDVEVAYGNIVKANGNMYYWKYNSASYENNAVFASISSTYQFKKGVKNQLICRTSSGKETVIMETDGCGVLCATKDRLFFQKSVENYGVSADLCSCKYDGSDIKNHGKYKIIGASEDQKSIIVQSTENMIDFCIFDVTSMQIVKSFKKSDYNTNYNYLVSASDKIIYSEKTTGKGLNIYTIGSDGNNNKKIYTADNTIYEDYGMNYNDMIAAYNPYVQGDYLYFAYGAIAGTGHIYQGGRIAKVKLDGSGGQVVAGSGENHVADYYTVDTNGNVHSYGDMDFDDTMPTMNNYSFKQSSLGFFNQQKNEVEYLFGPDDYKSYTGKNIGFSENDDDDTLLSIEYFERVDDKVFVLLHKGTHNKANDMGWRYSYDRNKSYFFEKDIKLGKTTLLYEF